MKKKKKNFKKKVFFYFFYKFKKKFIYLINFQNLYNLNYFLKI